MVDTFIRFETFSVEKIRNNNNDKHLVKIWLTEILEKVKISAKTNHLNYSSLKIVAQKGLFIKIYRGEHLSPTQILTNQFI